MIEKPKYNSKSEGKKKKQTESKTSVSEKKQTSQNKINIKSVNSSIVMLLKLNHPNIHLVNTKK
jgi:hypothetical protein